MVPGIFGVVLEALGISLVFFIFTPIRSSPSLEIRSTLGESPSSRLGCRFNSEVTSQMGLASLLAAVEHHRIRKETCLWRSKRIIMHTQMSRQKNSFSCPVVAFRTGPILGGFQASGGQRQSHVTGWMLISSRVTRAPGSPRASRSPAKRNNITPLLQASPVDGCLKRFQRYSSLRNHLKYRKESTVNAIDCS